MPLEPYDYDRHAPLYDLLSREGESESVELNRWLHRLLRRRGARRVLDFSCGTGAQALGLARYGYELTAVDPSEPMLEQARRKGRGLGIRFRRGDLRSSRLGRFDAAISMFNAVGHLDREEFAVALRNVRANLRPGGTFIFDIFNRDYLEGPGWRGYRYLDLCREYGDLKVLRWNDNRLDRRRGVLHVRWETWIQRGFEEPWRLDDRWDMQLYRARELRRMLLAAGFTRLWAYGGPDVPFDPHRSLSLYVVARRR